ncbi:hypothetical protein FOZ63_020527 [Perkinsus olseni]|uniref:Sodium/calcium exchanger membrane region domain-containing protein n=1 Tax=Perkinsus olseni TaxID=32597 RepID=A0A7J6SN79_PEROL|nr:hypothetical protein FOZ62_017149 [Perkinsus olseni]KAF4734398.1 hypothetical protein FOZ63_020527 [Perkinsus olseni]
MNLTADEAECGRWTLCLWWMLLLYCLKGQSSVCNQHLVIACRGSMQRLHLASGRRAPIGCLLVSIASVAPELSTSISAAVIAQPTIGVGCVMGCNMFALCVVLGAAILSLDGSPQKLSSVSFIGSVIVYMLALVVVLLGQWDGYTRSPGWWLSLTIGITSLCVVTAGCSSTTQKSSNRRSSLASPLLGRSGRSWPVDVQTFLRDRIYDVSTQAGRRRLMQASEVLCPPSWTVSLGRRVSQESDEDVRPLHDTGLAACAFLRSGPHTVQLHFSKEHEVHRPTLLFGSPAYDSDLPPQHDPPAGPATCTICYSRIAFARDLRGPQCRIALSLLSDLGDVSIVEMSTPDDEAKSAVLSELSARGIEIVADDGPLCSMMLPKLLFAVCSSRASIGGEKQSTMLLWFRRVRYALGAPVDLPLDFTLGLWTAGRPTGAIGGLAVIIISFAWLMAFSLGSCVALVAIADSSGFPLSLMSLTVYSIGLNLGNFWTSTTTLRLHESRRNVVDVLNYGARSIYLALALPLAFVAGIAVTAPQRETLLWLMVALVTLAILARLEGMNLTRITGCTMMMLYFLYCFYLMSTLNAA